MIKLFVQQKGKKQVGLLAVMYILTLVSIYTHNTVLYNTGG